jgi:hypothetical protein
MYFLGVRSQIVRRPAPGLTRCGRWRGSLDPQADRLMFGDGLETFPFERRERIPEKVFQQTAEDILPIRAVCHDEDSSFGSVKAHNVMSPAVIVSFFEEGHSVRRPVKSPTKTGAQFNIFVLRCRFRGERREHVLRRDPDLRGQHQLTCFLFQNSAIDYSPHEQRIVQDRCQRPVPVSRRNRWRF